MDQIQVPVKKIVAYYRINAQEDANLDKSDQKQNIQDLARHSGAKVEAEYRETESGRNIERPELTKAIAHARRIKGTLVVAKLDRLSRNAAFLLQLSESKVDFVCCDNPYANPSTIDILAAVAENDSRLNSQRIKAGIAQVKKKGVLLGSARPDHWKGREHKRGWKEGSKRAAIVRTQTATKYYDLIRPRIQQWREKEGLTYEEIADRLNDENYQTSTGGKFNTATVWRILKGYPVRKKKAGKSED